MVTSPSGHDPLPAVLLLEGAAAANRAPGEGKRKRKAKVGLTVGKEKINRSKSEQKMLAAQKAARDKKRKEKFYQTCIPLTGVVLWILSGTLFFHFYPRPEGVDNWPWAQVCHPRPLRAVARCRAVAGAAIHCCTAWSA